MRKIIGAVAFASSLFVCAQANATVVISTLSASVDQPGLLSGWTVDNFLPIPGPLGTPLGTANFHSVLLNATFSATPGVMGTPSILTGSTTNVSAAPYVGGFDITHPLVDPQNALTKASPGRRCRPQ